MNNLNPPSRDIDIKTQEGLDLLKKKIEYYGHYAEQLKVLELIEEIENLRESSPEKIGQTVLENSKNLGW